MNAPHHTQPDDHASPEHTEELKSPTRLVFFLFVLPLVIAIVFQVLGLPGLIAS